MGTLNGEINISLVSQNTEKMVKNGCHNPVQIRAETIWNETEFFDGHYIQHINNIKKAEYFTEQTLQYLMGNIQGVVTAKNTTESKSYLGYCNACASLPSDKCPKTSLAFHYAVWNAHLAAEGW
jgi:hypothetical protein